MTNAQGQHRLSGAGDHGFTLVEVLVVLAIIGVLATVALPRLQVDDGSHVRAAAHILRADLRLLRDVAIRTGSRTDLVPKGDGYDLEPSGLHRSLPNGFALSFGTSGLGVLVESRQRLRFFDDGSSTGGVLVLEKGASTYRFEVRGLDGQVTRER